MELRRTREKWGTCRKPESDLKWTGVKERFQHELLLTGSKMTHLLLETRLTLPPLGPAGSWSSVRVSLLVLQPIHCHFPPQARLQHVGVTANQKQVGWKGCKESQTANHRAESSTSLHQLINTHQSKRVSDFTNKMSLRPNCVKVFVKLPLLFSSSQLFPSKRFKNIHMCLQKSFQTRKPLIFSKAPVNAESCDETNKLKQAEEKRKGTRTETSNQTEPNRS